MVISVRSLPLAEIRSDYQEREREREREREYHSDTFLFIYLVRPPFIIQAASGVNVLERQHQRAAQPSA